MIRQSIEIGTKVFHEFFGIGIFRGCETKDGIYKGFAFVEFDGYPGRTIISRKKLTEIVDA